ncbi:MAG: GNAT family N-acetyltransferase [Planctomycetaceae bacterium]|nr:GNAT family N-acetyltransferase [Planctomycetaceae bacterium]
MILGPSPDGAGARSRAKIGQGPDFFPLSDFTPPPPPSDARLHLEPLGVEHTERDFEALMSSREHLRRTLAWGDWPPEGFTVEANRVDLERHRAEFDAREAYAYTVLDPTGQRCLGCVYLMPMPGGSANEALLALWVREDEVERELDVHLLRTLADWFEASWPLASWVWPIHPDNPRGRAVAEAQGLAPFAAPDLEKSLPGHRGYAWHR